jgi:hypothetical protein
MGCAPIRTKTLSLSGRRVRASLSNSTQANLKDCPDRALIFFFSYGDGVLAIILEIC